MLVLASALGCLDPVASAVAALSTKSPFVSIVAGGALGGRRAEADAARRSLREPQSDFLSAVGAFEAFEAAGRWGGAGGGGKSGARAAERRFCEAHFLSPQTLDEYRDLRRYSGAVAMGEGRWWRQQQQGQGRR